MQKMQSVFNNSFSFSKTPPRGIGVPAQYLLAFFLFAAVLLPSCRVKEGCAANQKGYTNSMSTKKRGKTSLFSKSMKKKMKVK